VVRKPCPSFRAHFPIFPEAGVGCPNKAAHFFAHRLDSTMARKPVWDWTGHDWMIFGVVIGSIFFIYYMLGWYSCVRKIKDEMKATETEFEEAQAAELGESRSVDGEPVVEVSETKSPGSTAMPYNREGIHTHDQINKSFSVSQTTACHDAINA
jgi:hypothetical protein